MKNIDKLGLESEGHEEADSERMNVIATSMPAISESLHKEIDLVSNKLETISVPHWAPLNIKLGCCFGPWPLALGPWRTGRICCFIK